MTKQAIVSSRYLITPSLLNSWARMWTCADFVKEEENDKISIDDKIDIAREKAKEEFINVLNRIPTPTNKYMQMGIDFEKECYDGTTCISPIINGGSYQIVGKKDTKIDGINFLMYGRLDVLKGGTIYDIKRVGRYSVQKYQKSYQHAFYLYLFSRAEKFTYLIYDGNNLHTETYYRSDCVDIKSVVKMFIEWLKENDLIDIYLNKWLCKGDQKNGSK